MEKNLLKQVIKEFERLREKGIEVWYTKTHGEPSGIPDIIACINGRFVAIELKTSLGRLRECQKVQIRKIHNAGGLVVVLRDIKEMKKLLKECGIEV